MTVKIVELAFLLLLALISDLRTYKIDNRIIVLFAAAGIITNLAFDGLNGLLFSLAGILLPMLLLFWLFLLRMLGAGDVKLFCAIGAVMGPGFAARCTAYSFLAGGVIALALMLTRRNARQRLNYLGSYLKACFLSGSILEYSEITDRNDGAKFRFSPAIAFGAIIQVLLILIRGAA